MDRPMNGLMERQIDREPHRKISKDQLRLIERKRERNG